MTLTLLRLALILTEPAKAALVTPLIVSAVGVDLALACSRSWKWAGSGTASAGALAAHFTQLTRCFAIGGVAPAGLDGLTYGNTTTTCSRDTLCISSTEDPILFLRLAEVFSDDRHQALVAELISLALLIGRTEFIGTATLTLWLGLTLTGEGVASIESTFNTVVTHLGCGNAVTAGACTTLDTEARLARGDARVPIVVDNDTFGIYTVCLLARVQNEGVYAFKRIRAFNL